MKYFVDVNYQFRVGFIRPIRFSHSVLGIRSASGVAMIHTFEERPAHPVHGRTDSFEIVDRGGGSAY
jgi:hypothetical protein